MRQYYKFNVKLEAKKKEIIQIVIMFIQYNCNISVKCYDLCFPFHSIYLSSSNQIGNT